MISDNTKGNPNHDEKGRFSSSPSSKADGSDNADDKKSASAFDLKGILSKKAVLDDKKTTIPSWLIKKNEGETPTPINSPRWEAFLEKVDNKEIDPDEQFESIELKGIEPEYQKEIKDTLGGLMKDYPIKGFRIKTNHRRDIFGDCNFEFDEGNVDVHNWTTQGAKFAPTIHLNREYQANKTTSREQHLYTYSHRGSMLVNCERPDLATVSHEYGHALIRDWVLRENPEVAKKLFDLSKNQTNDYGTVLELMTAHTRLLVRSMEIEREIYEGVEEALNVSRATMEELVEKNYGSYASTNYAEFFAEAFANMRHLREDQKTDFMKTVETVFKNKYNAFAKGKGGDNENGSN